MDPLAQELGLKVDILVSSRVSINNTIRWNMQDTARQEIIIRSRVIAKFD